MVFNDAIDFSLLSLLSDLAVSVVSLRCGMRKGTGTSSVGCMLIGSISATSGWLYEVSISFLKNDAGSNLAAAVAAGLYISSVCDIAFVLRHHFNVVRCLIVVVQYSRLKVLGNKKGSKTKHLRLLNLKVNWLKDFGNRDPDA